MPSTASTPSARVDTSLRAALEEANIPSLLMALYQLTGDGNWLSESYRPKRQKGLGDNDTGGLSPEVQAEIRDAAHAAVVSYDRGEVQPVLPAVCDMPTLLSIALDETVPAEYGPLIAEEFGLVSRDVEMPKPPEGFHVVIIGAGLSGLCAAFKLRAAGIPFTILEKDDEVGGTWLENTYPGCGVDTPGHLYCFSFDPNIDWTRYFAKRDEVWDYLRGLSMKYDVRDSIRFGVEVETATYDSEAGRWHIAARERDGGEFAIVADVLVPAVGMVNRPSFPPISGIDQFAGPLMHTAQWDSTVDLTDKRVAVIGTGASAMQLLPAIVDAAAKVTVFQRSKQWAVPHPNYQRSVSDGVRLVMRAVPFYAQWYRLRAFWNFSDRLHPQVQVDPDWEHKDRSVNASNENHRLFLTKYITDQLADRPDLIEACLPEYPPYGKRPLIDNGWFATIKRPDVDLVTAGVAEFGPDTVVAADGREFEVDVVIFATGFRALQFLWPMEIRGRSGTPLSEAWGMNDARAYLGLTVPDFPNMFILNGPNTNAGHGGSAVIATEFQVRYLMLALRSLMEGELCSVEVREDVFWDYIHELDEALARSIWAHPGMTNWYRNENGRVVISSPWKYLDYWDRTLCFDPSEYQTVPRQTVACDE